MVANLNLPAPAAVGDEWGNQLNAAVQAVNAEVEANKTAVVPLGNGKRLGARANAGTTDWNDAVESGWYYSSSGVANSPNSGQQWLVFALCHTTGYVIQTAYPFVSSTFKSGSASGVYRRVLLASSWGPWYPLLESQAEMDARYPVDTTRRLAASVATSSLTDYNDATESGWLVLNGTAANRPPVSGTHYVEVRRYSTTFIEQTARNVTNGIRSRRRMTSGTWGDWVSADDEQGYLDARYGPSSWTSWSPTFVTGGTIGNATRTGEYVQVGKRVDFWGRITLGSTSSISSALTLSVPVTMARTIATDVTLTDTGSTYYDAWTRLATTTSLAIYARTSTGNANQLGSAIPFTWAPGDIIDYSGTLKAA